MGQIFDPSDWTNFTMSSALDAAVKSLPGGQYGSIFYPGQKNTVLELPPSHALGAPSWHDESEMTGRERPDGLVCFESLVMIHEHQHYFRDAVDAEYYRRVVRLSDLTELDSFPDLLTWHRPSKHSTAQNLAYQHANLKDFVPLS